MEKIDFEKTIASLENVVSKLEKGDVTLDESLELFEKGVKLAKACSSQLDKAEQRVMKILKNSDGEIELSEFAIAEDV